MHVWFTVYFTNNNCLLVARRLNIQATNRVTTNAPMPTPLLYRNLTKSLVIVSQHIECLFSAQQRDCLQPECLTSENAYYRQCYRSLVSMQSINMSRKVWICQDILSWYLRILIGSTDELMRFFDMSGYYKKFCRNFSMVAKPLTKA